MNLNQRKIPTDSWEEIPLQDYGINEQSEVTVMFKDLDIKLIGLIEEADYALGCVAWLTHPGILSAMARLQGVSVIVQKEDWLRPDTDANLRWAETIRSRYRALRGTLTRYDAGFSGTRLRNMSCGGDPGIDAVRCVGNHNSDRNPASPRSHHKFLVLCEKHYHPKDEEWSFLPYAVWTGSFNFTANAVNSFENAVLIRSRSISMAYLKEYAQVAALSEPLNWTSEWSAPEWRVGS